MSNRRRKLTPEHERFIMLKHWEFNSLGFQSLSADAVCIYIYIRARCTPQRNGTIPFSFRDGQRALHSASRRTNKAFAELVEKGFLKPRQHGQPGPGIRPATEWACTAVELNGQPATKDFMRWRQPEPDSGDSKKRPPTCEPHAHHVQDARGFAKKRSHKGIEPPQSACEMHAESGGSHVQNARTYITIVGGGGLVGPSGPSEPPKTTSGAFAPSSFRDGATALPQLDGAAFQRARSDRGKSQQEVATAAGVSRSFVAAIEQGKRQPDDVTRKKMLRALGLDPAVIYQMTDARLQPRQRRRRRAAQR